MTRQEDAGRAELPLTLDVVPFEPLTPGSGERTVERKKKLQRMILESKPNEILANLRDRLRGRLVKITLVFCLWKDSPNTTNIRRDLDNLLKIPLDVLRKGPIGVGILEEDSFVCEVLARKVLVGSKGEEGYRFTFEERDDLEMLHLLKRYSDPKAEGAEAT